MPQNLFSRLLKYRASDRKTPWENFLTEAFAAVLENDKEFTKKIIDEIYERKPSPTIQNMSQSDRLDFGIETQQRYEEGQPDLIIFLNERDSNKKVGQIVFENKWGSPESGNQLEDYLNLIDNEEIERLIYLTEIGVEDPKEVEEKKAEHIFWNYIAKILKESIEERKGKEEKIPWISTEFLNWLKEVGMAYEEFKKSDIESMPSSIIIVKKLVDCIQSFQEVKKQDLDNHGLSWNRSSNTPFDIRPSSWGAMAYTWISGQDELALTLRIRLEPEKPKGSFPVVDICIESKPRGKKRKEIESVIKAKFNDKFRNFGFDLKSSNSWDILYASVSMSKFQEESEKIPFEKIHYWWSTRLDEFLNSGIIEELKKI